MSVPYSICTYEEWEREVDGIYDVKPVAGRSRWLLCKDDPSPIELQVISPEGRRTGFDPISQTFLDEDPQAQFGKGGAWTDPLGEVPPGDPAKFLAVENPIEGTYRFQVVATGTGQVALEFSTVANGTETPLISVQDVVVQGELRKYEARYSLTGTSTVTPVTNFTPEAKAGNDQHGVPNVPLDFDGSCSFDSDGTIVAYAWDFGDGTTATGARVTHTYTAPKVYTVTLTVTDDGGTTGTDTLLVVVNSADPAGSGLTERVSVSSTGAQGNDASSGIAVSADGRFVAFLSSATNLVPNDLNRVADVFVRDRQAGTTERVSVSNTGGESVGGEHQEVAISANGRFVAFASRATNLVPQDMNNVRDVFVRDRQTGTTERVNVSSTGEEAIFGDSRSPSISADGRFVAFVSAAANLAPNDTNGQDDVFVRDRLLGTTERVSISSTGEQAKFGSVEFASSGGPAISADGRFVAFVSNATNLDTRLTGTGGVFVHDRQTGTTELVSLTTAGLPAGSGDPSISADGRFVAFTSSANNVVPTDHNNAEDVFVRDRMRETTEIVSISSTGAQSPRGALNASISADGRFVVFDSTILDPLDFSDNHNVYVRDRQTGTTERASVSSTGELGNASFLNGFDAALSADGRVVAFVSDASNLVPGDTNLKRDVFIRAKLLPKPVANPSGPYIGWASSEAVLAFITFDGSQSFDPNGQIVTATWDYGDGSPPIVTHSLAPIQHTYFTPGKYTVTLVVNNGTTDSDPATTTVEVLPPLSPDAITVTPSCTDPGTDITISGFALGANAVLAQGGRDLSRGPLPLNPITLQTSSGVQTLSVTLPDLAFHTTLTLPLGLVGQYSLTVQGGPATTVPVPCPPPDNYIPAADAGGPYSGRVGQPIMFDGSRSSDLDGDPLTYTWYFGDGSMGSGVQPQHIYLAAGTYYMLLKVNDGQANSSTSPRTRSFAKVVVAEAPADTVPPTTTASASPQANGAGWNNTAVTVTLSATDNAGGSGVK